MKFQIFTEFNIYTCAMKPGMTRWKGDPLYPKPGVPLQSWTKFSAVLGTTSFRSSIVIFPTGSPFAVILKKQCGFGPEVTSASLYAPALEFPCPIEAI